MLRFLSLIFVFLFIFLFYSTKQPLTQKRYMINIYGYIMTALIIISISVLILRKRGYIFSVQHLFASFIASLLIIMFINNTEIYGQHILWFIYILMLSLMIYPLYTKTIRDGTTMTVLLTTFSIFFILSLYVYFTPEQKLNILGWGKYLLFGLITLIIFQIISLFTEKCMIKTYAIVGVILFSGFILYDTNILLEKARIITENNLVPTYPVDSLNIILDIINMFSNVTTISK